MAGQWIPYGLGRKGGEAFIRKRFSAGRVDRLTASLKRHGLVAVLVACLLPPPAPFKLLMMLSGAASLVILIHQPRAIFFDFAPDVHLV
mgnify:CR=1 FL=1